MTQPTPKMTNYIIAIVGASGSGKTTISRFMAEAGIPDIVSYTTRPMRPGEREGVEHHFITTEQANELLTASDNEDAAYTEIAGHQYFTLWSQFEHHNICTYVIDEYGLIALRYNEQRLHDRENCWSEISPAYPYSYDIVPVRIIRDADIISQTIEHDRIARDKDRIQLEESVWQITIINDSPSTDQLRAWSMAFATSLRAVLTSTRFITRCTLHTKDDSVSHIINTIAGVETHT